MMIYDDDNDDYDDDDDDDHGDTIMRQDGRSEILFRPKCRRIKKIELGVYDQRTDRHIGLKRVFITKMIRLFQEQEILEHLFFRLGLSCSFCLPRPTSKTNLRGRELSRGEAKNLLSYYIFRGEKKDASEYEDDGVVSVQPVDAIVDGYRRANFALKINHKRHFFFRFRFLGRHVDSLFPYSLSGAEKWWSPHH